MKDTIKQIIESNLPEKDWTKNWDFHQKGCSFSKRGKWVIFPCDMNCKNVLDNFTQINTSLIADEVLKVVVEKIKEFKCEVPPTPNNLGKIYTEEIVNKVIKYVGRFNYNKALDDLLSNLSPNKENKNNE